MNRRRSALLALLLFLPLPAQAVEHDHEAGAPHRDAPQATATVELTPDQIQASGLEIASAAPGRVAETVIAPGVVRYNSYAMADITAQMEAVVAARHVRLGERVARGDRLLTLKSGMLAQAQAGWLRADAAYKHSLLELERLIPLAQDGIVSQARLQQSQSQHAAARAEQRAAAAVLSSYGLSPAEVDRLDDEATFGTVLLRAPVAGTVIFDPLVLGQHVAAGDTLLRIVDESTVWIEANLTPDQLHHIAPGNPARVGERQGGVNVDAAVIGIHHELDTATRTAVVRIEADNRDHTLHPGMFVDAEVRIGQEEPALLIPAAAVQRQGEEQIVFVATGPGRFERREVTVGAARLGMVAVRSGLRAGDHVVIRGAFSLLSELLKSGFEAHNH